jgi:hypothetical protein
LGKTSTWQPEQYLPENFLRSFILGVPPPHEKKFPGLRDEIKRGESAPKSGNFFFGNKFFENWIRSFVFFVLIFYAVDGVAPSENFSGSAEGESKIGPKRNFPKK